MKKITLSLISLGILVTFTYGKNVPVSKVNERNQLSQEKRLAEAPEIASRMKEFVEIQKKMFDIERNAIQQDQELKQMAEQIRQLQQQLRERIEERLKSNDEYQSLKQRRDRIKQEYRKIDVKKSDEIRRFEKK